MEKLFILTYMPLSDEYEACCLIKTQKGKFELWDANGELDKDTLFEYEELRVFEYENGHKSYEFTTSDGEITDLEKEYFKYLGVDYTVTKNEQLRERRWCTGEFVDKRKLIYD